MASRWIKEWKSEKKNIQVYKIFEEKLHKNIIWIRVIDIFIEIIDLKQYEWLAKIPGKAQEKIS